MESFFQAAKHTAKLWLLTRAEQKEKTKLVTDAEDGNWCPCTTNLKMIKYEIFQLFRNNERAAGHPNTFRERGISGTVPYVSVGPSCLGLKPYFQGELPRECHGDDSRTAAIALLCDNSNYKNKHSLSLLYYQLFSFFIVCIH